MKLTDWIIAVATVAIVWLTYCYVALQGDLVTLQKALANLQDTIVKWQTRIQVEARPFFRVTEEQEFGKPGTVGLRVANLSSVGVWLDTVEVMILEGGPKSHCKIIRVDDVLAPDQSREVNIWTVINDYCKQDPPEMVRRLSAKFIIKYVAASESLMLIKECSFEYIDRRARNFVLTVP
jgi:hypothetical protein